MNTTELAARVGGTVFRPGDDEWDAARVFHSGIGDPDLIVRVADLEDVRAAVAYAAATDTPVAVRGGGHSAWESLPGAVVVDLSRFADVDVDAATRIVRVGGGATWGAVARTLAAHGLGLSSGDTASVGVGGLTLGGGIGWMVRAWGLAADQLVGAQLVTAHGDVLEVSRTQHPELFWALRGGGGNFGVVTRFDFAAHAVDGVVFGTWRVDSDRAATLRALRDVLRAAPREVTATFLDVPPMDPNAPAGASISVCAVDSDVDAVRALLAPVAAVPGVHEEDLARRAYPDILLEMPAADPDQPVPRILGGNTLLAELDDDTIRLLTDFRARRPASVLLLRSLGGAYGDVPQDDTPFPARRATWFAMGAAFAMPGMLDEEAIAATRRELDAIGERGLAAYGNFVPETDPVWARRMYLGDTWQRLAGIKRRWDPHNLFRRNHNVPPADADGTS